MNIQEFEVMNNIVDHTYINQRELARVSGYSVGKVNQSIKTLTMEGYLEESKQLTEKAKLELEKKRPKMR